MENLTNASQARLIATHEKAILDVAELASYETFIFLRSLYANPAETIGVNPSLTKFLFNISDALHNIPSNLRARSISSLAFDLLKFKNSLDRYTKNIYGHSRVIDPVQSYINRIQRTLNKLPKEAEEISCYRNY